MPTLAAGNTVYTHPVAKVMISMPGNLLERLDRRARELGETRSGFLQRLAERELTSRDDREDEEIGRMLDSLEIDLGGIDAAQAVREDRESH
ncbi:MAG TPA: type II toxin-antitoxin system HicB family antitoxin [Solirubrobacterales bacterium]|nr:type II toxin-antitoxin system HicB family antitoxin [Solirubrobacterales bacterium]